MHCGEGVSSQRLTAEELGAFLIGAEVEGLGGHVCLNYSSHLCICS